MLTVRLLADSFEAHLGVLVRTSQLKRATADWYASQLARLRGTAGWIAADDLRPHHLADVEFSNHFVRTCKSLYRWALEEELVTRNPFAKIKTPPAGERSRVLTGAELLSLYRAAPPAFRLFLFFQLHTMARPGELRELRWRDVHLDDRLLKLTAFKGRDRRRDGVKVRLIPLDQAAARRLSRLAAAGTPDDHVFRGDRGRPWTANALRCAMRRTRERARIDVGKDERVVCYHLRHTAATDATRRGIRDAALAAMMGHANTRTTARYQHLDGADLVEILDRHAARGKSGGDSPGA